MSAQTCSVCGRLAAGMCSGCNKVAYCDGPCQNADWPNHSVTCSDLVGIRLSEDMMKNVKVRAIEDREWRYLMRNVPWTIVRELGGMDIYLVHGNAQMAALASAKGETYIDFKADGVYWLKKPTETIEEALDRFAAVLKVWGIRIRDLSRQFRVAGKRPKKR